MTAELGRLALGDPAGLPALAQAAWAHLLEGTVFGDLWARPGLDPAERSLISVAALATLRSTVQLRRHLEIALRCGVTASELCGALLQVAGYAGLGVAEEALQIASEVLPADGPEAPVARTSDDERFERGLAILEGLRPGQDPLSVRYWFAPDWRHWLVRTVFGELWARDDLTPVRRERVTLAVLVTLGREREIAEHVRIARTLEITAAEIGEELQHLAPYVGFPAVVGALRVAEQALIDDVGRREGAGDG